MRQRRSIICAIGAAFAGAATWKSASAADEAGKWPTRPLTIVVPFDAGGVSDAQTRSIARRLGQRLGQPIVVENRSGAGGMIATEYAARQPADGYTLVFATQGTMAVNLALYKAVRYDPLRDFIPIHGIYEQFPMLLVKNDSRFKKIDDLLAFAKANPDKVMFGSGGAGTATHLSAELFQTAFGIRMTHVPFRGAAPAMQALLAGTVDLVFDFPITTISLIQSGKIRPLLVAGPSKLPFQPEAPTIGELGHPEAVGNTWTIFAAPAKTPQAVVDRIAQEMAVVMADPEVVAESAKIGSNVMTGMRGEKLRNFVASEIVKWRDVVKRAGASVE